MTYVRPTARQRELLAALVETGDLREAARRLGITYGTATVTLWQMRRRSGFTGNEHAIYVGTRDGWLSVRDPHMETAPDAPGVVATGV